MRVLHEIILEHEMPQKKRREYQAEMKKASAYVNPNVLRDID